MNSGSVNDERTMSTITWMGSKLRSRQSVATIGRLISVRQAYMHAHPKV
jgi:hypothetical protein